MVLTLLVVGCGGSGSAGNGGDSENGVPRPTSEFVIPGGDNTIQYFGREGSAKEREEASQVVIAWDRARAAEKWKKDCSYLSRPYIDLVVTDAEGTSKGKATNCVEALEFFGPLASGEFGQTTTGPIDSLRISQKTGYAQYHGRKGIDWIVPLEKEDGKWKVAVTAPVDRRK